MTANRTKSYVLLLLVFTAAVVFSPIEAWAVRQRVCVNADGSLVVKRRCRANRGQVEMSLEMVSEQAVGPQGEPGPAGPQGHPGLLQVVTRKAQVYSTSGTVDLHKLCEPGEVAVGGGAIAFGSISNISLVASAPTNEFGLGSASDGEPSYGWRGFWRNPSGVNGNFNVLVLCAVLAAE
ncbi:MAG: hypothetical protein KDD66_18480 [Bdellovibrionales bacterium]|nr:hypothetical protein [Bdellovibrionales bacterium]